MRILKSMVGSGRKFGAWRVSGGFPVLPALLLTATIAAPWAGAARETKVFLAGAYAQDVTPTNLPVIVNGGFLSQTADKVHDRLHVRWLVLDDGRTRAALGVLDTCIIPGEFADAVRARAQQLTSIPTDRIMLSAVHTHSTPSLMRCLGTDADTNYLAFVLPRIVEGLQRAVANLGPARVGWAVAPAPEHTHTRVWIRRPDKLLPDPFGDLTIRANMHPGHQNPDTVGPSGPSDPALTLLAVQSPEGRPIAVLANYSMHYFGAPAISADYYGAFAEKLGPLIGAGDASPAFVGIMSQGTSGDQHWMDYSEPKREVTRDAYAGKLAQIAADAYRKVVFHDWAPLVMRQKTLRLATRQPDAQRLAWARELVAKLDGRSPRSLPEVYAGEQLWLHENPTRLVLLQALRVGDLGIAIWPCEVFALSGLKIKAQSPLQPTMNIELANGEEGYIPPPELYPLGGYNTWACRTASLETNAEPKIVDALLGLLEKVSGQPRRKAAAANGAYAQAVLAAKPLAYWRLEEPGGPSARNAASARRQAVYEPGAARWLEGPQSPAFSGAGAINRCPHFAGGRLHAKLKRPGRNYTVEFWFWNGLPNDARPVTGYLFGRGAEALAISGTNGTPGILIYGPLAGRTVVAPKTWNHVALVRDGSRVAVHLNGNPTPEMAGEVVPDKSRDIFFGGRSDKEATLEGRIDEIALYKRALSPGEVCRHYQLADAATRAVALNP
ncbi:MAG TPA: hypothetical protein PKI20_19280 [Verrucomicrobiota bacterium]|nr:hypothetical protein [Verrucomicrobiota bacterium]